MIYSTTQLAGQGAPSRKDPAWDPGQLAEDEDEEDWPGAGGCQRAPTRVQLTVGVGAAVAAPHDPGPHGLPECRSKSGGARAADPRF